MSIESTPDADPVTFGHPVDEFDEFDDFDVEGDGLQSLTVALGAASVVVGGAGVALAGQQGPFDRTLGGAGSTITAAGEEADALP